MELNDQKKRYDEAGTEEAIGAGGGVLSDDRFWWRICLPAMNRWRNHCRPFEEQYQKPAFCFDGWRGNAQKGSGRSIEQYHMLKGWWVKDLLLKFGGHPMAAGLSLEKENIDEFRRRLNEEAELTEDFLSAKIWIDVPMPLDYINEPLIEELELLEPFGQGNEKPLFALKGLHIRSVRVLGKNRNAVKFSLADDRGVPIRRHAVYRRRRIFEELGRSRVIDVIYYPTVNVYNGSRTLQIIIKNYKIPV